MLFIVMKLSMLVYNIAGGRLPILVAPLGIVPKISRERSFVLSDPAVPRTFVMDCTSSLYANCYYWSSVQ